MKYLLYILVTLLLLIAASCGEGEDQISGKYTMTEFQFSGCADPLGVDLMFDNGGLCAEEDGFYRCVFFCLTFTETSLQIDISATEDGNDVFTNSQTVTFDPESEAIDFCLPTGTCEGVTISEDKSKLTFTGFDDDTGCDFVMVLER